jgi:hypothetical protein
MSSFWIERRFPHRGDGRAAFSNTNFSLTGAPVEGPNLRRARMSNPKLEVLTPQNSQIIFIDHQPQMAFGNSGGWGIGGKPLTTEAVKALAAGRQSA